MVRELLEELDGAPSENSREGNAKQKRDRRDNKLSTIRPNVGLGEVQILMVTGLTDNQSPRDLFEVEQFQKTKLSKFLAFTSR